MLLDLQSVSCKLLTIEAIRGSAPTAPAVIRRFPCVAFAEKSDL